MCFNLSWIIFHSFFSIKKVIQQYLGSERNNNDSGKPHHKVMGLFQADILYSRLCHSFQLFWEFFLFFLFSEKNFYILPMLNKKLLLIKKKKEWFLKLLMLSLSSMLRFEDTKYVTCGTSCPN